MHHPEWLPCTICLPHLLLIAQSVFLLQCRYIYTQRDGQTQSQKLNWSPYRSGCGIVTTPYPTPQLPIAWVKHKVISVQCETIQHFHYINCMRSVNVIEDDQLTLNKTFGDLGPVAPISVNFNHQLTQHHRHDNSNSRATSANSSRVKWVSQLS